MRKNNALTGKLLASVALVKSGKRPRATVPSDMPEGVRIDREGNFVLPEAPASRADILYTARQLRLDLQRRVERLSKLEGEIQNYFIETLPVSQASGIAGRTARVQIETKPVPTIEDWDRFYAYVRKTNGFDLLQRRLNEGAVKERLEAGKRVPGVGVFNVKKVSCTKI